MIPIPSIEYASTAVLAVGATFFVKSAELDARSRLVRGGPSLAAWLVGTFWIVGGFLGGLLSQVVSFVALAAIDMRRDRELGKRSR